MPNPTIHNITPLPGQSAEILDKLEAMLLDDDLIFAAEGVRILRGEITTLVKRNAELAACFPPPLTHGQTLAKRALLARQLKQLNKLRGHTVGCAGCGKPIPITEARKCHWCGCWYGRCCSDAHFGANPDKPEAA